MARTIKHRYCGGQGWIRLVSGADATCQPCCGTGRIITRTKAEKAAIKASEARFNTAREVVRKHAATVSVPEGVLLRASFPYLVVHGLEMLAEREPERLEKLYASLDSGRLTDVVQALYTYHVSPNSGR